MRVAVDVVVVAEEHVLLVERLNEPFKELLALPGGFVEDDELLVESACRELAEEAGVLVDELLFVGVFDSLNRDSRGRVVSVAFATRLAKRPSVVAGSDAASASWVALAEVGRLAFDHNKILARALEVLR
jgi:8-oxo-dGTP diphosphatase